MLSDAYGYCSSGLFLRLVARIHGSLRSHPSHWKNARNLRRFCIPGALRSSQTRIFRIIGYSENITSGLYGHEGYQVALTEPDAIIQCGLGCLQVSKNSFDFLESLYNHPTSIILLPGYL